MGHYQTDGRGTSGSRFDGGKHGIGTDGLKRSRRGDGKGTNGSLFSGRQRHARRITLNEFGMS